MVVVSHLFFFFDKKFGEGVTRYESHPPSLELSISRQPLCNCVRRWAHTKKQLSGLLPGSCLGVERYFRSSGKL